MLFSWPQAAEFKGEISMNMFNATVVIQFSAVEDSGVPYIAIVQLTTVQRLENRYRLSPNYWGELKRGKIDEKALKKGERNSWSHSRSTFMSVDRFFDGFWASKMVSRRVPFLRFFAFGRPGRSDVRFRTSRGSPLGGWGFHFWLSWCPWASQMEPKPLQNP